MTQNNVTIHIQQGERSSLNTQPYQPVPTRDSGNTPNETTGTHTECCSKTIKYICGICCCTVLIVGILIFGLILYAESIENTRNISNTTTKKRIYYTACQSGNYDVASTWCADDIPSGSSIVDIPSPFTVMIPLDSQPEFFRLDIHGVLQAHIGARFPPDHSFTISVFDDGLLSTVGDNEVIWLFPSNSILFVHFKGKILTKSLASICNMNLSICTTSFNSSTGSFTIANIPQGEILFRKGITFIAIKTGTLTTEDAWCGGQAPMIDICQKNQICNLIILSKVELTVDHTLFNNFNDVHVAGTLILSK